MSAAAVVYRVVNSLNGHDYVGITRFAVQQRWKQHLVNAQRGLKTYLYSAIRKYGPDAFHVEQIATCLSEPSAVERALIQQIRPVYNQTNGGEFTKGKRVSPEVVEKIRAGNIGKKRTPEQKAMSRAIKLAQLQARPELRQASSERIKSVRHLVDEEKRIQATSKSSRERIWSDESRAKLSASCKGRRYGTEVLEKIAAKKRKPVVCRNTGVTYASVSEAAEATGVSITSVSRVCLGKRAQAHGLAFSFC